MRINTNEFTNDELLKIFSTGLDSLSDVQIVSYYQDNIHPDIPLYQRKVFNKFDIDIVQYKGNYSHTEFLNSIFSQLTKEYLLIFDVDCIPLCKEAVFSILSDISNKNTLAGGAQTANHKSNGENIYVGPFFLGISKLLLQKMKVENVSEDEFHDVGAILTTRCKEIGGQIKFWFPTEVELPLWKLYPNRTFGCGTIYNGMIYHAFQIRFNSQKRFIKKCKEVLKII